MSKSMNSSKSCYKPIPGSTGHSLMPTDPDSPMNWPLFKKIYTSSVAFAFAFVVLYGTTTYAIALPAVMEAYGTSRRLALLGFTLPFFGVFFAPIYTPHVAERYGRRPVYFASFPLFSLCVVVIGLAPNISILLAFRFLAGLFGGPCLVLIEGTFADVWSAQQTVTYYSFLASASYLGAALGPIIGGFVLVNKGAAWLSWVTLLFATFTMAFGAAMPETYSREILRERIRYQKSNIVLPCAESGVTLPEMMRITVLNPLKMLVTEPLVITVSLYLGLNFALVFQWFISVPAVLSLVFGFDVEQRGLAFLSAIGGTLLAVLTSALLETLITGRDTHGKQSIEARLWPAMVGSLLLVASLFWIGFTATPNFHYLVPISGTAVFVWGNAMILISLISYLFDAYPPAGTLSALTAAACSRLACAGIVPIFILDMITNLGGAWTYTIFGILSAIMLAFPFSLYLFGRRLREKSAYSQGGMTVMESEMMAMEATQTLEA